MQVTDKSYPPALTEPNTTSDTVAAGTYSGTIKTTAGKIRSYLIQLPPDYTSTQSYPTLFVLHGGGGNSERLVRTSGLADFAQEKGFILIAPNAYKQHWNDGRTYTFLRGTPPKPTDDVQFIHELQQELARLYAIDTNRLFLAGMSNGSIMSQRIICEDPGEFRAIAAVSGPPVSLAPDDCVSSSVSVLSINGTEDRFYPIQDGDLPQLSERISSRVPQVPLDLTDLTGFWPTVHTCGEPTVTTMPPVVSDGTTVTQYRYDNCSSGAQVTHYVVQGMGHAWPPAYGRNAMSANLNTNEVMWQFFNQL